MEDQYKAYCPHTENEKDAISVNGWGSIETAAIEWAETRYRDGFFDEESETCKVVIIDEDNKKRRFFIRIDWRPEFSVENEVNEVV